MTAALTVRRTDSSHPDLPGLIRQLDEHLHGIYGKRMEFFDLHNGFEFIRHVVIFYRDEAPTACGAIKEFEPGVMELKRMFVSASARGRGIGSSLVEELCAWAAELGYKKVILETGHEMPDAVALYKKTGFDRIENYGPYVGVEESWCFERIVG